MSKKAYIGVNGIAENVEKIYVGVNGVARKVIKGYVGVNGVAELFWDGGSTPIIPASWDFWTSDVGYISELRISKSNVMIAYYAAIHTSNGDKALLISPSQDAVAYDNYTSQGTVTDAKNIVWYYNAQGSISNYSSSCLLNDSAYSDITVAVQDLIDKIYYVPFHEEYYRTYSPKEVPISDKTKTIRKCYGSMLFLNYSKRENFQGSHKNFYDYFSENADFIIETILEKIGNDNLFRCDLLYSDYVTLVIYHKTVSTPFSTTIPSVGVSTLIGNGYYSGDRLGEVTVETLELQEQYKISKWIINENWTNRTTTTTNPVVIGLDARYSGTSRAIIASSNIGVDY